MMAFEYESRTYQIKPFICSTDDFVEEHNYLLAEVYPKLRSLCRERGASFNPHHWDHNLNPGKLAKGQALYLALECINSASPFFIGFIGNQYGPHRPEESPLLSMDSSTNPAAAAAGVPHWIDKNMMTAAGYGYKWLLDESYNSASLFELKVTQAAFLSEETRFCRFYIREKDSSGVDRFDKFKLQQLKTSIAKRGLHVSYYKQLKDLGQLVLSDWIEIINQLYPPLDTSHCLGHQLLVDRIEHRCYGERRCENLVMYSSVSQCFSALSQFARDTNDYTYDPFSRAKTFERATGIRLLRKGRKKAKQSYDQLVDDDHHKSVCVLTGPRGCGKTAIVSGWLSSQCDDVIPRGTLVISHYAGCDRMARDVSVFMRRCIIELRKAFSKDYDDHCSIDSPYSELSEIKETFVASLALGPCLIILDGLDEIAACCDTSMTQMKGMEWLAEPLPPTCKFIFTVTDSDLAAKALRNRSDSIFIPHQDLTSVQCKTDILNEYLSHSRNPPEVSDKHLTQITTYKLSSSPIYLYMMASELKDMHVNRDMSSHLDVYANCDSISTSTRDMWANLIKRWVRDYSWTRYKDDMMSEAKSDKLEDIVICGWVPDTLRLIACSRNGLSPNEILGILLYGMGYMGRRTVTLYDWYLFYTAAKCVFYEKPNGLITINHEHFTELIDFLLLGNISPPSLHETSADLQGSQRLGGMERRQYHISLSSHLLSKPAGEQLERVEEILWQLEIASDYTRLCNILLIPSVMEKMHGSVYCTYNPKRAELRRLYKLLRENNIDLPYKVKAQLNKLGFMKSHQDGGDDSDLASNADLSLADPQSAAFSMLSRSELYPSNKQAWRPQSAPGAGGAKEDKSVAKSSIMADSQVLSVFSRDMTPAESRLSFQSEDGQASLPDAETEGSLGTGSRRVSYVTQYKEEVSSHREGVDPGGSVATTVHKTTNTVLLISKPCTPAEVMQLALTCSKLLMFSGEEKTAADILTNIIKWCHMRYPLTGEELYILCHVNEELAKYNTELGRYSEALEQLYKSHECLLDISSTDEENGEIIAYCKLTSYIKAKLKIGMSEICIRSGELPRAQGFIDEATIGMKELTCTPGVNYTLFKLALLRVTQRCFTEATTYLSQCLEYFELWFGTMHPVVAEICHSLGKLLSEEENRQTNDYVAAEEYLWKALNIRRERDSQSLLTADSLFQLAFLIQKQGSKTRKKEAVELLQDCLDIRTHKLGNENESTKLVVYMLNDLEISLQLGQYEFGVAKPIDQRSAKLPFSQLSMHEKALMEYSQRLERKQRSMASRGKSQSNRPMSAFTIENPRSESRLYKALIERPKTAPTKTAEYQQNRPVSKPVTRPANPNHEQLITKDSGDQPGLSTTSNSPRTYRSYTRENMQYGRDDMTAPSRLSTYSCRSSVLEKYSSTTRPRIAPAPKHTPFSTKIQVHKCHNIGPHTIHKNLNTVTLGPNCDVYSVAGHVVPSINDPPVHLSAWYHLPNHYATVQKPNINLKVYAQRKKRLMHQRSQTSPLHSRFINDHSNALHHVARHESDFIY